MIDRQQFYILLYVHYFYDCRTHIQCLCSLAPPTTNSSTVYLFQQSFQVSGVRALFKKRKLCKIYCTYGALNSMPSVKTAVFLDHVTLYRFVYIDSVKVETRSIFPTGAHRNARQATYIIASKSYSNLDAVTTASPGVCINVRLPQTSADQCPLPSSLYEHRELRLYSCMPVWTNIPAMCVCTLYITWTGITLAETNGRPETCTKK